MNAATRDMLVTEAVRPNPRRLRAIDLLRGGAALAVLLCHANNPLGISVSAQPPWAQIIYVILKHGALGVPLFFVISGFCIHLRWAKQYAETGKEQVNFVEFWRRRFHRLYPPYLLVLCLTMTLMFMAYLHGKANLYPQPRLRWLAIDFTAHVFMLHGFHPILDPGGGDPPMWTLAREEYFYLMYFVLLPWRRSYGLKVSVLVVFALGIAFRLVTAGLIPARSPWLALANSSALVLWIQWCLGMVAVEAYYGLVKLPRWCSWPCLIPFWATAAKLADLYCASLTPLLWGMTFFTLVNYCVGREASQRWPRSRLVNWLCEVGIFSYSLYLLHSPVVNIVSKLSHSLTASQTPAVWLLSEIIQVGIAYYMARLFFWLVERHFLNPVPKVTYA